MIRTSTSFVRRQKERRGCPGHLVRRRASRFCPGMTGFDECDYSTRQGKFAPPGKPSLRGATATKQSISPQTALWIASRSLSSGARSRDPLARNDDFGYARATNRPDGQISSRRKFLSSPARKNIPLPRSPKSVLSAKHTSHGGAGRDRHERGVDAVDAAASGASGLLQGGSFREQGLRADDRR